MKIIEEIEKLKNTFIAVNNDEPNCVKVGKRETQELENWYDIICKQDSDTKKVKINDGAMVLEMRIIKTKDKSFLEVAKEDLSSEKWKAILGQ